MAQSAADQELALIFRALADSRRRLLLDRLFERDGRTLGELELEIPGLTRFGVMRHIRVLEKAGLVVRRHRGRRALHYLNRVPIQQIHRRWVGKYSDVIAEALVVLKEGLETAQEEAGTVVSKRWQDEAAERFEAANHTLARSVENCSESHWKSLTPVEGWSVAVTAHHAAEAQFAIAGTIRRMVVSLPVAITDDELDTLNVDHEIVHQYATRAEVLQLLQAGGIALAQQIRSVPDEVNGRVSGFVEGVAIGHLVLHGESVRAVIDPGEPVT